MIFVVWSAGESVTRLRGKCGLDRFQFPDASRVGVDIEAFLSEESEQRNAELVRAGHGETGWCADGAHQIDAGDGGFLKEFKARPAAQQKDVPVQREIAPGERGADEFVQGVVAANILMQREKIAVGVEEAGRVKAASGPKNPLFLNQRGGEGMQRLCGNRPARCVSGVEASRVLVEAQCVDACLSADAAARGDKRMPLKDMNGRSTCIGEFDLDQIACAFGSCRLVAMTDGAHIGRGVDDPFGEKETECEVKIFSRSAHCDGKFASFAAVGSGVAELEREWFLAGYEIIGRLDAVGSDFPNGQVCDGRIHGVRWMFGGMRGRGE